MVSSERERTIVIVARHGEREDYAMMNKGGNWVQNAVRPWDPPLSGLGWKQATSLGICVKDCINKLELPQIRQIYSSPFQRCLETSIAANTAFSSPSAKIEYGLAESLNESWYRSWSLPTSNGAWGYKERDEAGCVSQVNLSTLHRAAIQPASYIIVPKDKRFEGIDYQYKSTTRIHKVYCWGSFETGRDQQKRLKSVVKKVAQRGSTVMLVSHAGPVAYVYQGLIGDDWSGHGEAGYASFSIYEKLEDGSWIALVTNKNSCNNVNTLAP
mmetsp:Transcript_24775/g.37402  ORF Transcript_24775/g.37402 Transcript_24775/m.37402 type:complete len:270 (+) Transcript_24775:93-902(+)